eukprot:UN07214
MEKMEMISANVYKGRDAAYKPQHRNPLLEPFQSVRQAEDPWKARRERVKKLKEEMALLEDAYKKDIVNVIQVQCHTPGEEGLVVQIMIV